jgi:hypothetical protein
VKNSGSSDHADYPSKIEFRNPGLQSLVSATDAVDVAITGGGTIDGNGESGKYRMIERVERFQCNGEQLWIYYGDVCEQPSEAGTVGGKASVLGAY